MAIELGLFFPEHSYGAGLRLLVTVRQHTSSLGTLRPAGLCGSVPTARGRGVVQHNTIQAGTAGFVRRAASGTRVSSKRQVWDSRVQPSGRVQPGSDHRVDRSKDRLECILNSRASATFGNACVMLIEGADTACLTLLLINIPLAIRAG